MDPVARDAFWRALIELSRREGVTIFISTHFMNEAERCDRISLMHAGQVLVSDTPQAIMAARGAEARWRTPLSRTCRRLPVSRSRRAAADNPVCLDRHPNCHPDGTTSGRPQCLQPAPAL